MLRVLVPLLLTLSLLIAPLAALAGQTGMHADMMGEAMTCATEANHHGAPGSAVTPCQMMLEQCAIACTSLPVALARADGVSLVAPAKPHWPRIAARHQTGQEPALPDQPPRPPVL